MTESVNSTSPNQTGKREPRFRRVPIRLILPNLVTLLALCSGLTAIRMAFEGRWEFAIGAVLVAAVLDALDGRVARLLKGTSKFGAELDSLADFVNFGVTPALMLYIWILKEAGSLGWIAALIFAISAALRLARFNVALEDPDKPAWTAKFFTGVPAPAGALTVLMPLYLEFLGLLPHWPEFAGPIAAYTIAIAFLMISRLPTFSGKTLRSRVRRDFVLPLILVVVLIIALTVSYPFRMLAAGSALYLITIPFAWRSHRKHLKADSVLRGSDDDGDCGDTDLDHLGDRDKHDMG
ncbi:CDP-diacylglycerol--serine O-phosphatidyltransferase [Roseibium hamelinense]|uniref:CDP-diacylglycerol--serine O-phosphatidyltransferase n=1 Tax=Roseibium hamelinense TaxID=150831 RepID=A0A562T8Q6_9HYPH|nr:phosphatidylcholine/phosphatidylserine synthase [Roseibium hamelinense]MTI43518.1 phosphatidylcholine/phosphatidylserine synthase [Roseibium hamelinense]TWI89688.1 CDP-diacylglycerol--serine O-phosphatidyltransferase [Roseibium hamelinense]